MLTRKYYEMIAADIKTAVEGARESNISISPLTILVDLHCVSFKADNSQFRVEQFREACGL